MKVMSAARVVTLGAAASCMLSAGCSFLYNPDSLSTPPGDALDARPPPDVLDPNALVVTTAGPPDLYEGQGANGSPQTFLVIGGGNISAQATITLVPTDGGAMPPYTFDLDHLAHAEDNSMVAVPVTLPVDPATAATDVKVTVHVQQTGAMGEPITADLPGKITIHTLPELDDAHATVPASAAPILYSQVVLTQPLVIPATAGVQPTIIHSMSTIALSDVTSNGDKQNPGRGGGAGGATTLSGGGLGGGSGSVLGLLAAGGGGGFGTAGSGNVGGKVAGDALISSYATNTSGGGGGGSVAVGGGGGGTIELHAEGALTVGKITANGADGGSTTVAASGSGGGGSGGAIVVRAGDTATLGALSVVGGKAGTSTGLLGVTGTAGGLGRIRVDAPTLAGTAPAWSTTVRQGVVFATDTPLISRDKHVQLLLDSAISSDGYYVYVYKDVDTSSKTPIVVFSTAVQSVSLDLFDGYNKICVAAAGIMPAYAGRESSCVEVAYVWSAQSNHAVLRDRARAAR